MTNQPTKTPDSDWLSELPKELRESVRPDELRGPVSVGRASTVARNSLDEGRWKRFLDGTYSVGIFEGID